MTFTLKPTLTAILLTSLPSLAMADHHKSEEGKLSGMIKMQHVADAKNNGYDPNSGQAVLFKLKYLTPKIYNTRMGIGFYAVGDIFNNTNHRRSLEGRPARGLFATNDGSMDELVGELYLDYKTEKLNLYGGQKIFNSPLTTSLESTLPDFHTVFGVNVNATPQLNIGLAHMTEMSLGSRSANEFGLTGEGTGTAGTTQSPSSLEQAEFHKISEIALGKGSEDTAGLTMLHGTYKPSKRLNFTLWDYYAHDIFNALYAEGTHVTPLKGKKLKLSAQYLNQSEVGDKLAGDIDFGMLGIKAALGNKKWGTYIAMNKSSGKTGMYNTFSGDPGYTSTQFSRNEYRENVTAYKIGARYKIAPQWTLKAAYANYGKSDTVTAGSIPGIAGTAGTDAQKNATETNLALIWKPTKKTMIKVAHANRVSEFDGANGRDLTMGHTRIIAVAKF